MGLKLGGSKTKSSSVTNSNSTSTTTKLVPEWASSLTQGIAGQVGRVAGMDPYSLVPGANALQDQAAEGASGLSGMSWNYDQGAELLRGVARQGPNTYDPTYGAAQTYRATTGASTDAQSASLLDNLDAYMSPYRRDVVDAALADYDAGAGQTRAQQDLDLAGAGAFGGSGAALTRSMTEDSLVRGRASTSANLLDQMFQRGAALSSDDANRRQQVSLANAAATNQFGIANMEARNGTAQFNAGARNQYGLANMEAANAAGRFRAEAQDRALQRQIDSARGLVDLSSKFQENQRANISTQADLGKQLRDIEVQRQQAPLTHAQQIVAMLNGLPINLFTGEQTQSSGTQTTNSKSKTSDWGLSLSPVIPGPLGKFLGAAGG